jgi:hypothetical protein
MNFTFSIFSYRLSDYIGHQGKGLHFQCLSPTDSHENIESEKQFKIVLVVSNVFK